MSDEMSSSYGSHTTELASVGRSNSTGSPLRVTLVVYSIAWGDALRATPLVTLLCCLFFALPSIGMPIGAVAAPSLLTSYGGSCPLESCRFCHPRRRIDQSEEEPACSQR